MKIRGLIFIFLKINYLAQMKRGFKNLKNQSKNPNGSFLIFKKNGTRKFQRSLQNQELNNTNCDPYLQFQIKSENIDPPCYPRQKGRPKRYT
jgi:hypothetical protein